MRFRTPRRLLCGLSLMTSLALTLLVMLYPGTLTTAPTMIRDDGSAVIGRAGGGRGGNPAKKVKPVISHDHNPRDAFKDEVKVKPFKDMVKVNDNAVGQAVSVPSYDFSPDAVAPGSRRGERREGLPPVPHVNLSGGLEAAPRPVAQIPEAMRRPPVPEPSQDTKAKNEDELWHLLMSETLKPLAKDRIKLSGTQRSSNCTPKHHIFFGKVHKTGSSTVSNILQRYGFSRGLNFVVPRKRIRSRSYNYISYPGDTTVTRRNLIPPPIGEHYDILWNHALYDSKFYHSIMPSDTVFVTILRQPLQQLQSTFEYYGRAPGSFLFPLMQMNVSNPISLFLRNTSNFRYMTNHLSYIRNKQSHDLGMKRIHAFNATVRRDYIQQLSKEFSLVMITEHFDESLVMLRRLMCWEVRDVLYMPMNTNPYKKKLPWTKEDVDQHKSLNMLDFELYDFFLRRFKRTMALASQDFLDEVAHFKKILRSVKAYCSSIMPKPTWLHLQPSKWSDAIDLEPEDCRLLQKQELVFLDDIMVDAIRRYQKSVPAEPKPKS